MYVNFVKFRKICGKTGLTLIEVSASILILSIVFTAAFRMDDLQRKCLRTAFQNNLALFLLESQRNRVIGDLSRGISIDEILENPHSGEITLPPGYSVGIARSEENSNIVKFVMEAPGGPGGKNKIYIRELKFR